MVSKINFIRYTNLPIIIEHTMNFLYNSGTKSKATTPLINRVRNQNSARNRRHPSSGGPRRELLRHDLNKITRLSCLLILIFKGLWIEVRVLDRHTVY